MDKNKLLIPIAIVIAGALIGGALFFSGRNNPASSGTASAQKEIALQPVTASDHILGNPSADIVLVEFSDLECPFCKQFHTTLHTLLDKYQAANNLAWAYRHYPIPELHPKAAKEAEATECAADQGGNDAFWKFTDLVYTSTPSNNGLDAAQLPVFAKKIGIDVTKFNECLASGKFASKVADEAKQGAAAGGSGTPYSILVMKTPLSKEKQQFVEETNAAILQQVRSAKDILYSSPDGKKVAISGAFPLQLVDTIIGELLKK